MFKEKYAMQETSLWKYLFSEILLYLHERKAHVNRIEHMPRVHISATPIRTAVAVYGSLFFSRTNSVIKASLDIPTA